MAKVVTDNQYYTAIANAIRALTGSSDTYTPAQMAPAIISYIAGVDLSDVESYFVTEVVNAMKYVKELGTDDWVHHIVTTDNHFVKNYGHSTAIVKAMQDSGYFSKVINLGDVSDTGDEADYTMAIANYGQFNGDMLFAIGNHDVQVSGYETVFYNAFLSNDTDIVVDPSSNLNYYWDDAEHQIRYIVYNYISSSDGAAYAVERIKDAPSGYAVLCLCHYKDKINNTSLIPIIGRQVKFIGHINGHYHIDAQQSLYGGQFINTSLNNDGWTNDKEGWEKVSGTNTEQAITIMSINLSTNKVKFRRIGKATTLGQSWEYTYVQGGTVEYWERGYNWGLGTLNAAANSYYNTKVYPALDANDNALTYKVYTRSGTLTNIYVLGIGADGNMVSNQRLSAPVSAIWNRVAFWQKKGTTNKFTTPVTDFLVSINSSGDIASTDDIVITAEHVDLGVSFANVTWESGKYLNANVGDVEEEGSVASYAFDLLPSTTYRFYVDDADWSGTNYLYAFAYYDEGDATKSSSLPALSRRVGANAAGSKEFTFTTKSTEYYCRISARGGLANVENWQSKCHLEVVTA